MDEKIIFYLRIYKGKHRKNSCCEFFSKGFPWGKKVGGEIGIFQNQLEIRVRELITAER